jgi:hypothetical protein
VLYTGAIRHKGQIYPALTPAAGRATSNVDGKEMVALAKTVQRYFNESQAAGKWADAYTPAINAHLEGQENYELAMLCGEIGIVIASLSLLLRRRMAWYVAMALGLASVAVLIYTYARTEPVVRAIEEKTTEAAKAYRSLRAADKTTAEDDALAKEVLAAYQGR